MVVNRTVDLYWGRSSRIWCCRSLLGRCGRLLRCGSLLGMLWKVMALLIFTGDGVVGYVAVDLYWGRCGRECGVRSLLVTEW